ncbi:MAG: YgiT-type zinc finger protein [Desulfobacterales bacterium]|nr:YgiT-type zinc finger protein [Desulfobacterales bacterium]
MNCPICNSEMVCKRTIHHYTESGLDNVFLDGVEVCQCSCSEKIVSIPAIPEWVQSFYDDNKSLNINT